jgi:hypothetical protein
MTGGLFVAAARTSAPVTAVAPCIRQMTRMVDRGDVASVARAVGAVTDTPAPSSWLPPVATATGVYTIVLLVQTARPRSSPHAPQMTRTLTPAGHLTTGPPVRTGVGGTG